MKEYCGKDSFHQSRLKAEGIMDVCRETRLSVVVSASIDLPRIRAHEIKAINSIKLNIQMTFSG